jgi:hypothetical protein
LLDLDEPFLDGLELFLDGCHRLEGGGRTDQIWIGGGL